MYTAILFCLLGQTPPPPPAAYVPGGGYSVDQPPNDPQGKREWLLAHIIVDMLPLQGSRCSENTMQAQGKYDAQQYREIERMLSTQSPQQLGVLVQYYQQRKAQVAAAQLVQAESNLRRLEAYRDHLKREFEMKLSQRQMETQMMGLGVDMANNLINNIYGAYRYPYYGGWHGNPGYVYRPHHHHPHDYHAHDQHHRR